MTLNEYLSLFINSVVKFAKIANVFCIGVLYFYLYNLYNSLNTFPVITAQKEKTLKIFVLVMSAGLLTYCYCILRRF